MTAYVCELTWLGGERPEADVVVEVEDGRFTRVEPGGTPPPGAERLDGLTLPGFANAHSHAFQRALRGRTESSRGSFWSWRDEMYRLAARLDPDSYHALARATFAEMALAGIVVVGEFHYLHHEPDGTPYADPNEVGRRLVAAADEAGIRITLLDACYLEAGPGEPLAGAQRRFGDGDASRWVERVDDFGDPGPGARLGAAIHSVRAVDPQAAAEVAGWAAARGAPLHAHVSEQPAENESCAEAYGRTPTGVLNDAGAVAERFTAVHFTHVTDDDKRVLGSAGATACLCPTTERDLADGVGPARAIAEAGAALALGSDSHSLIDPFEEMRAVELDERLATGVRGHHSAAGLLAAATAGGHRALGWPQGGRIEPGAIADLVTVGLDGVRLAGTTPEAALEAVVFAAAPADVRRVIVGGREIVRDGRHVEIDVPAELKAAVAPLVFEEAA